MRRRFPLERCTWDIYWIRTATCTLTRCVTQGSTSTTRTLCQVRSSTRTSPDTTFPGLTMTPITGRLGPGTRFTRRRGTIGHTTGQRQGRPRQTPGPLASAHQSSPRSSRRVSSRPPSTPWVNFPPTPSAGIHTTG